MWAGRGCSSIGRRAGQDCRSAASLASASPGAMSSAVSATPRGKPARARAARALRRASGESGFGCEGAGAAAAAKGEGGVQLGVFTVRQCCIRGAARHALGREMRGDGAARAAARATGAARARRRRRHHPPRRCSPACAPLPRRGAWPRRRARRSRPGVRLPNSLRRAQRSTRRSSTRRRPVSVAAKRARWFSAASCSRASVGSGPGGGGPGVGGAGRRVLRRAVPLAACRVLVGHAGNLACWAGGNEPGPPCRTRRARR